MGSQGKLPPIKEIFMAIECWKIFQQPCGQTFCELIKKFRRYLLSANMDVLSHKGPSDCPALSIDIYM